MPPPPLFPWGLLAYPGYLHIRVITQREPFKPETKPILIRRFADLHFYGFSLFHPRNVCTTLGRTKTTVQYTKKIRNRGEMHTCSAIKL